MKDFRTHQTKRAHRESQTTSKSGTIRSPQISLPTNNWICFSLRFLGAGQPKGKVAAGRHLPFSDARRLSLVPDVSLEIVLASKRGNSRLRCSPTKSARRRLAAMLTP